MKGWLPFGDGLDNKSLVKNALFAIVAWVILIDFTITISGKLLGI